MRVLTCHDNLLIAEGAVRLFENALDVEGRSARSWDSALQALAEQDPGFDLLVADNYFSGHRVDALVRAARQVGCGAQTLVLATNDSPIARAVALSAGAAGYVAATADPQRIAAAAAGLFEGRTSFGFEDLDETSLRDVMPPLTRQESRVLVLLNRGLRFKQIALSLGISEATVKGYARAVFNKLGVNSRAEAVYEARSQGLLEYLEMEPL
ncbi:MAG TPA: response regulator transcription factor [Solirubrobacterales bacterium]|jgi:DNA-binding NarL/FixJ family response regulator|nr:response regulator transcription factor [Solirubrobacterales bacterium]